MATDVVTFSIGKSLYALDISLAREIMEMVRITPVPKAPSYIAGIINLRGEITNILRLNSLLGLPVEAESDDQKIIVLVAEACGGSNMGIIVDDVHSVTGVEDDQIEKIDSAVSGDAYVKGVIKARKDGEGQGKLIIWIDLSKLLTDQLSGRSEDQA